MERLVKQIAFIKEIDKVKYILRRTKLFNSDRRENDAEHSWHLAMLVMTLAEHANEPIDVCKTMKMVLIHDIVEIDTGDIFFFDKERNHDNTEEELKAAKRIFGMLPEDQAEEFLNLWIEFETKDTPEARFARAVDRLEPMLQNASNNGGTWQEFDVHYDAVLESKMGIDKSSKTIWEYILKVLEESVERGILKRD